MSIYTDELNTTLEPKGQAETNPHNLCYAQYEIDFSGNANNTPLNLIPIAQCGDHILLTDDSAAVVLCPGYVYLTAFNARGTVPPENYFGITPLDEPDAPTADYSAQAHASVSNAEITVSNTFLVPALTGKQLKFLLTTSFDAEIPVTGTISIIRISAIKPDIAVS